MNEQADEAIDDDDAPNSAASATPPAKTTRRKRPAGSKEARIRFEQERAVAVAKSRLNERRRRLRTIFDSGGDLPAAAIAVALTVIRQTHEATGEGPTWGHIGSVLGHRAPPSVEAIMLELTALGLVEHSPQPRSLRLTDAGAHWLQEVSALSSRTGSANEREDHAIVAATNEPVKTDLHAGTLSDSDRELFLRSHGLAAHSSAADAARIRAKWTDRKILEVMEYELF